MSSTNVYMTAENSRESLLDGQFTTGAATNIPGWIQATFLYPVAVTSVTIAPLHKNSKMWNPIYGTRGTLEYSHDNNKWITVGTIVYVAMQQQKIATGNVTAQYWRLRYNNGYLGTSSFVFQ